MLTAVDGTVLYTWNLLRESGYKHDIFTHVFNVLWLYSPLLLPKRVDFNQLDYANHFTINIYQIVIVQDLKLSRLHISSNLIKLKTGWQLMSTVSWEFGWYCHPDNCIWCFSCMVAEF
jgi:hypothetical protein